jgi:hypothetical protein
MCLSFFQMILKLNWSSSSFSSSGGKFSAFLTVKIVRSNYTSSTFHGLLFCSWIEESSDGKPFEAVSNFSISLDTTAILPLSPLSCDNTAPLSREQYFERKVKQFDRNNFSKSILFSVDENLKIGPQKQFRNAQILL